MSDLNKHTPGPWSIPHFARSNSKCKCHYVFSDSQSGFGCVASVPFGNEDENHVQAKANANLISAAPDLLEALETIKRRMYEPRKFMLEDLEALIDQVIAKARGQS